MQFSGVFLKIDGGFHAWSGIAPVLIEPGRVLLPGAVLSSCVYDDRIPRSLRSRFAEGRIVAASLGTTLVGGDAGFARAVGIGRVEDCVEAETGLFIRIRGLSRGEVVEVLTEEPLLRARVTRCEEIDPPSQDIERFARRALLTSLRGLCELSAETAALHDRIPCLDAPLGVLVDWLADRLLISPALKLRVLAEPRIHRRATLLAAGLDRLTWRLFGRVPAIAAGGRLR